MDRPSPKMEEALLVSPRLRAARYADRLDELSTDPQRTIRGRRRLDLKFIELLPGSNIDPIHPNVIKALERKLGKHRPLFDRFTTHYRIPFGRNDDPATKNDKLSAHIYSAQNRNKRWSKDPDEQAWIMADRARQPRDVEDNLQRTVFRDRNIATMRKASITAIQYQVKAGHELDRDAGLMAADAIADFGSCLTERRNQFYIANFKFFPSQPKSGAGELTGPAIGAHLRFVGEQAAKHPEILVQNPVLLELVADEQSIREEYWGTIYDASIDYFGDRLTDLELQDQTIVDQEVARLARLQEAA